MICKLKAFVMIFVTMSYLCGLASAEEEKTILETLSNEETATLKKLSVADRRYAIGCLSSHNLNRRNGFYSLREGEYFVQSQFDVATDQVLDEQNFLASQGTRDNVWVEGVSTRGIADGGTVFVRGIRFVCVGNKTYATAGGGSRTVMHVVQVNPDNAVETLRPIAEARGLRVWGEGTGNLVLAEFVRASSKELTIKLWDGKRKTIQMKAVGAIDSEWIESENKK